jgi:glycosyltransferase involved in cell wall biosynthesis
MPAERRRYSVIIATCQRREYVVEAVRSVVEQTLPAEEILVVVDGSTDGTAEVVRKTYPGVVVIEQPNRGAAAARNAGIAEARGEWLCFLDDDDLWHREKLAQTDRYLDEHPGCLAVRNPVWWFGEEKSPAIAFGFARDFVARSLEECHGAVAAGDPSKNGFGYLEIEGKSFELLLECNRGALSSSVIRRDVVITAGGFCPSQSCGEEWTLFVNVARLCEWHTLPVRLTFCRLHPGQNTVDPQNGLYTLTGFVNAWLTGRAGKEAIRARDVFGRLAAYGPVYRGMVQGFVWGAIRKGRLRLAWMMWQLGKLLLPRRRDVVYAMLPPHITWRFERYFLGMHKG